MPRFRGFNLVDAPSPFAFAFAFLVLTFVVAPPAFAQYVFLDANGDGVNDGSDRLNETGPTQLDVWFVTNQNKDGSPAVCSTNPDEPLTINSYEIVLLALNGTIRFGPMENRLPFSATPGQFAGYEDTTSTSVYHNGWGYRDILPPGRYLVATLTVEILTGSPSLAFAGRSPLQPVDQTSFGTQCTGPDFDNTYALGEEFFDASGIGRPMAVAGGPYQGVAGAEIQFDGRRSVDPDGDPMEYAWSFDDGGSATGAQVRHAYAVAGIHTATLTVSNDAGSDDDVARVLVTEPSRPAANAGGPYHGMPGYPIPFDGSLSFDPDGDPLFYVWDFGDGQGARDMFPHHLYATDGVYTVTLTVSDGVFSSTDETTATVATRVNHAPIASAGGPYTGIAGRWIQFVGTGSSDADGDFLRVIWDFGDGVRGIGIVTSHAYAAAGDYTVVAYVSDGFAESRAETTAEIAAGYPADAFLDGRGSVVSLDDPSGDMVVRFEPEGGSFSPDDVAVDDVELRVVTTSGATRAIAPVHAAIQQDDTDGDGTAEFVALFPLETFRDLVDSGTIPASTTLRLAGGLNRGGEFEGAFDVSFRHSNRFALSITPNPFNPVARIVIQTRSAGPVTAKLFDVQGRRVKTLIRGESLPAGRHDLLLDAKDERGAALASGLYFLQVTTVDGTRTGRVVVAK